MKVPSFSLTSLPECGALRMHFTSKTSSPFHDLRQSFGTVILSCSFRGNWGGETGDLCFYLLLSVYYAFSRPANCVSLSVLAASSLCLLQ